MIEIPSIVQTQSGLYEDVSDINGIAIPCMYYDYIQGLNQDTTLAKNQENRLYQIIRNGVSEFKTNQHTFLYDIYKDLSPYCQETQDYLYMANIHVAVQEKIYFKLKQISRDEYNWIPKKIIEQCLTRMKTVIGDDCVSLHNIEQTIIRQENEINHAEIDRILAEKLDIKASFRFTARVDLLGKEIMWEIKCTSRISIDHMLQVIIYAWILECLGTPKIYKIFNIKTGEILRLNATMDELTEIVVAILKSKYGDKEEINDGDFIKNCRGLWITK
jgi:hypothetical protein